MLSIKTPERGFFSICAAVFGYLLVAPVFKPFIELGWHDSQRILQVALVILVTLSFFAMPRLASLVVGGYLRIDARKRYWLLATLLWALVSAQAAALPRMALLEVSHYFLLFHAIMCVAACRLVVGKEFDRLAFGTLVLFGVLYSTAVIAQLVNAYSGTGLHVWQLFERTGFDNPRFFGQAQTLIFPIYGALLLIVKKPSYRMALLLLLALWWVFSIAAGTRATWLAMAVVICVAPFLGRVGIRWVGWQMLSLVAGMALYWVLFVIPNWQDTSVLINRLSAITTLSAREIIWQQAWMDIKSHPWLGVGPMHFALNPNGIGAHPHNAVLQWAAEMGLPFVMVLVGLIFTGYRCLLRHFRNEADSEYQVIMLGLFLSLLAGAAHAMVDGIVVMPYAQTLIVLIAGWAIGITTLSNGVASVQHPGFATFRIGYSLLLVAVLLVFFYGIYPEVFNLLERENSYGHMAPRFWRLGWLQW